MRSAHGGRCAERADRALSAGTRRRNAPPAPGVGTDNPCATPRRHARVHAICAPRRAASSVRRSARQGGTDTTGEPRSGHRSRPVPRADVSRQAPCRGSLDRLVRWWAQRRRAGRVGSPPKPWWVSIRPLSRAGHGFDPPPRRRVNLKGCPAAEPTGPSSSARPNLENSTACQKSMPNNLVARVSGLGPRAPASDPRTKNPLVDNE